MPANYQKSYHLDDICYYSEIKAIEPALSFLSHHLFIQNYQWTFKNFISELKFEKLQLIWN